MLAEMTASGMFFFLSVDPGLSRIYFEAKESEELLAVYMYVCTDSQT